MQSSNQNFALRLEGNLTLRAITTHQETLQAALTSNNALELDLDEDVQADLSFIQLIESARIYAGTAGRKLVLSKPATGSLLDVLDRAGFLEDMSADDRLFWLHQGVAQ